MQIIASFAGLDMQLIKSCLENLLGDSTPPDGHVLCSACLKQSNIYSTWCDSTQGIFVFVVGGAKNQGFYSTPSIPQIM
jgi:hypothetical protein